jgi:predicted RNase H-like nuclease
VSDAKAQVIGIDGCRAGWVWAALGPAGLGLGLAETLAALTPEIACAGLTLIDIPIGLPEGGPDERVCDRAARSLLGHPRAASVFPVPCRATVDAADADYAGACAINQRHTGRRVSRQGFNILPKVREADRFLQGPGAPRGRLRESHPELVFLALAGASMAHNKKTLAGREERLRVLERLAPGSRAAVAAGFEVLRDRWGARALARDDLVDALALAVAARRCLADGLETLPPQPPLEARGLPMEMVIPARAVAR